MPCTVNYVRRLHKVPLPWSNLGEIVNHKPRGFSALNSVYSCYTGRWSSVWGVWWICSVLTDICWKSFSAQKTLREKNLASKIRALCIGRMLNFEKTILARACLYFFSGHMAKPNPKGNHLLQLSGVLYYSLTRFVCYASLKGSL